MTITDPKVYTTPIVVKHYWQRRPDIEVLEYVCGEGRGRTMKSPIEAR